MTARQLETLDQTPFATSHAAADAAQVLAGEAVAQGVRATASKAMKFRIESWVTHRGFRIEGSEILAEIEGVTVRAPVYSITEGTAVVTAAAVAPSNGKLVVEPRSFTDRLFRRGEATGDEAFDARWITRATGVPATLVDEVVREALRDILGWARATYEDGRITVQLDADPMCGARLLGGMDVASALARARVGQGAYR